MNTDLIKYYQKRAKEYENIYLKPERQNDLLKAAIILQDIFTDQNVFEIACGTGYWTEKISQKALSVFATDINDTVLEIAKNKEYANSNVKFGLADFNNYQMSQHYDGLFGGFIWSHILVQGLNSFLAKINSLVLPHGQVVFIDNNFAGGSNHPITLTDAEGNTFQTRKLGDGTDHLVLKNFPTEDFIREKLEGLAKDIKFYDLEYYWIVAYKTLAN